MLKKGQKSSINSLKNKRSSFCSKCNKTRLFEWFSTTMDRENRKINGYNFIQSRKIFWYIFCITGAPYSIQRQIRLSYLWGITWLPQWIIRKVIVISWRKTWTNVLGDVSPFSLLSWLLLLVSAWWAGRSYRRPHRWPPLAPGHHEAWSDPGPRRLRSSAHTRRWCHNTRLERAMVTHRPHQSSTYRQAFRCQSLRQCYPWQRSPCCPW